MMDNKDINEAMRNIHAADYVDLIGDLAAGALNISDEEFLRQYKLYLLKRDNYARPVRFVIEQFFGAVRTARTNVLDEEMLQ